MRTSGDRGRPLPERWFRLLRSRVFDPRGAMKRRDLVRYIGGVTAWLGCVLVAPATVRAQKRVPVVGILLFGGAGNPRDIGFVRELAALGYVEGRNISYTIYAADGAIDRLPKLVQEMMALSPDVIVGSGSPVAHALGEVTSNIPIVMTVVGDP